MCFVLALKMIFPVPWGAWWTASWEFLGIPFASSWAQCPVSTSHSCSFPLSLFKFAPLGSLVQVCIPLLNIYLLCFLCSLFSGLLLHQMLNFLAWTMMFLISRLSAFLSNFLGDLVSQLLKCKNFAILKFWNIVPFFSEPLLNTLFLFCECCIFPSRLRALWGWFPMLCTRSACSMFLVSVICCLWHLPSCR